MFDDVYPVFKVTTTTAAPNQYHKSVTLYRFKSKAGERYLIDVTKYPGEFHTIDFYRRVNRYAQNQFTELTGEGDSSRILGTAVRHMAKLLTDGKEDGVSFGFVGARMPDEPVGVSSKRFRV